MIHSSANRCHCADLFGQAQPEGPCRLYTSEVPPEICSYRATKLDRIRRESSQDKDELERLRKALQLLKNADNWARYAHITIVLNGQPITTVGNILAEAVGRYR